MNCPCGSKSPNIGEVGMHSRPTGPEAKLSQHNIQGLASVGRDVCWSKKCWGRLRTVELVEGMGRAVKGKDP